jgi:hypothetical protein
MPSHEWTRVVVLRSARDGVRDERLTALFAARDWFAIEHTNAHLAMAELCLRERAQSARAAWGLQRVEKSALVIIEPTHGHEHADLIRAVHRYLPSTSVWAYADSELTPQNDAPATGSARRETQPSIQRPITMTPPTTQSPIATAPKRPAPPPSAIESSSLELRESGHESEQRSDEPLASSSRISREEIDMLLHAEADDSSPLPASPPRRTLGGGAP